MPWQPFRRKNKYRHVEHQEEETSFDELLPRSVSDGNLVSCRAPSERFLLQNIDPRKSYGTCSAGSSCWSSFTDHTVLEGETLAGLSIRYNITIQDIKLANKIWTNEGLWPGRTLRIPLIEAGSTSLDLSGSETMSTDSQISANLGTATSSSSSTGSSNVSRRLSNSNNDSGLFPESPVSLPLTVRSPRAHSTTDLVPNSRPTTRRASIENLSDFLSKMDSSIAVNTKTSISLIKGSTIEDKSDDGTLNNTNSRFSEGYSTEEEISQSFSSNTIGQVVSDNDQSVQYTDRGRRGTASSLHQTVRGYQGYQNIC